MIGRLGNVVLEARDPRALAGFYAELLGWPVSQDDDWVYADPAGHPFCLCWG